MINRVDYSESDTGPYTPLVPGSRPQHTQARLVTQRQNVAGLGIPVEFVDTAWRLSECGRFGSLPAPVVPTRV
jgi:hypothetical protein